MKRTSKYLIININYNILLSADESHLINYKLSYNYIKSTTLCKILKFIILCWLQKINATQHKLGVCAKDNILPYPWYEWSLGIPQSPDWWFRRHLRFLSLSGTADTKSSHSGQETQSCMYSHNSSLIPYASQLVQNIVTTFLYRCLYFWELFKIKSYNTNSTALLVYVVPLIWGEFEQNVSFIWMNSSWTLAKTSLDLSGISDNATYQLQGVGLLHVCYMVPRWFWVVWWYLTFCRFSEWQYGTYSKNREDICTL